MPPTTSSDKCSFNFDIQPDEFPRLEDFSVAQSCPHIRKAQGRDQDTQQEVVLYALMDTRCHSQRLGANSYCNKSESDFLRLIPKRHFASRTTKPIAITCTLYSYRSNVLKFDGGRQQTELSIYDQKEKGEAIWLGPASSKYGGLDYEDRKIKVIKTPTNVSESVLVRVSGNIWRNYPSGPSRKLLATLRVTVPPGVRPILSGNQPSALSQKNMNIRNAHALLIGVGDYLHLTDLPATARDAQVVADLLVNRQRCGYDEKQVKVIQQEAATRDNIINALQELATTTNSDSTVFIFFSGHGGRILNGGHENTYLCSREADTENADQTAISGQIFSDLLKNIPARQMLIVLDACHASGSVHLKHGGDETSKWKAGLPESYYDALKHGSGRVVIASSRADQPSWVKGELSLFTHYFCEGLSGNAEVQGDGLIHVLDLFGYVSKFVQKERPEQTPVLKVDDLDQNFSIALSLGGQKSSHSENLMSPLARISEAITNDPVSGAAELSQYLAQNPQLKDRKPEVDLKRAELKRLVDNLKLLGPNENVNSSINRVVHDLLCICLESEAPPA